MTRSWGSSFAKSLHGAVSPRHGGIFDVTSRTTVVRLAAIFRAFVGLPRLAGSLDQSERVVGRSAQQRRQRPARPHPKRAPAGSWEYILDVGRYGAQRCQGCGKRFWIERRPKEVCPACGGELRETEERRRETKGGFACRKDCQAALTRKLTTLAEHTYVLPSRLSLREFLLKVWLPAIESGVRADDALRLSHAGRAAPRAAAGSGAAAEPERRPDQRPLRQAAQRGSGPWFRRPLPQHRAPRPCRPASCLARCREVGLPADQRRRLRRPAASFGPAQGACRLV